MEIFSVLFVSAIFSPIFAASLQRINNTCSVNKSRMKKSNILLLILLVMISVSQTLAQSNVPNISSTSIKGQVLDSLTNETIAYATLHIAKNDSTKKVVKMLATDADGKFQIDVPGEGEFLLTSQYIGKSSLNVVFQITGKEKTIDLGKLFVHDNQMLGEVVVSAVKPLVQVD